MFATHDSISEDLVVRSFRDPAGFVFRNGSRVLRKVNRENAGDLDSFLGTRIARLAVESGELIPSRKLSEIETLDLDLPGEIVYEHERIPFPSYPHEWPAEMLADAARLTLELFNRVLDEGFGLKDATPYNVLFRGPRPVFVDVLSFERRDPHDAGWMSYAQFVRTFLLPLLAYKIFQIGPSQIFTTRRDGLEPETVYSWAGPLQRWTPGFFNLVTLPAWMAKRASAEIYEPKSFRSAEQARFVLDRLLGSCRRHLQKLSPDQRQSKWTGYATKKSTLTPAQMAEKEAFVDEAFRLIKPRTVLDIGANEGQFSLSAARQGASVVAIDSDSAVVGTIWREACRQDLDVLPLIVDFTRPTPALGWRNRETESFVDRARGHFDLVMMLAVIHHILVSERVPLEELFELVEEFTTGYLLIEFIEPGDPMFQRIVRGREALYSHLTFAAFEAAASSRFQQVKSLKIGGLHRCLYLLRRRHAK